MSDDPAPGFVRTSIGNFPDFDALKEVPTEEYASQHPLRAYTGLEDREAWHGKGLADLARENGSVDLNLPTIGEETLDDLPFGPTPAQLVDPFLTPEGPTILYGPGGVGKGLLATYFARELVRTNKRVTIVDFENHPREWGRRAHGMGFSQADRLMVSYRAPFGHTWTAPTGSLAEIYPLLLEDLEVMERRCDYLIIDSFTMATSTGDNMGGVAAAQEFFKGLARLKRSALVIAHIAGGQDKWPDRPFGSVFVHNLARETWAVERMSGEEPDQSEGADEPSGEMVLELRNKKSNNNSHLKAQFFTFRFSEDVIEIDRTPPFNKTWADLAGEMLQRSSKLSTKELSSAFKAEEGITAHPEGIRKTLARHPGRFRKTDDVPYRWELVR